MEYVELVHENWSNAIAFSDRWGKARPSCTSRAPRISSWHIWARNTNNAPGGVEVATPPSQYRSPLAMGSKDVLFLDVPAMTGMTLGCIGAKAGETIDFQGGAAVAVFLTVVTCRNAKVTVPPASARWVCSAGAGSGRRKQPLDQNT